MRQFSARPKHVITASERLMITKAIDQFISGKSYSDEEPIDRRIKYLIERYNSEIITQSNNIQYIVRNFGPRAIEYVSEYVDISENQLPSILRYFAGLKHNKIAASTQVNSDSEVPGGYLNTNKFSCPSIKTDEQRNALEALEIAICDKFTQFENFCDRQFYLTSESSWTGTITLYDSGCYYIKLEGTRCEFSAFVQGDEVIRKRPSLASNAVGYFDVEGNRGSVYFMSRLKNV